MKVNNKIVFLSCVVVATFLFFKRGTESHTPLKVSIEYGNTNLKSNYSSERIWTHKEIFTKNLINQKTSIALENCCSSVYCVATILKESNLHREYLMKMRGNVKDIAQTVQCFYAKAG